MNLSRINSIKIWQPSSEKEYFETLHSLSLSNKRWMIGNSGKITEVHFFVLIFEKIKALFTRIDPTKKELLEYHVIKLLEYGHTHDLLNDKAEKIQKIAQKMNWGQEIILQDLFEQIKTPLEIKIDRMTERLSLYLKREISREKYSFSRAFEKIKEKFAWGLINKGIFDELTLFFKEWQKEWEPRPEQIKTFLHRKEYTEDYLNELEEYTEQLIFRCENFYKNLRTIIAQNGLKIFFSFNGLQRQIHLERGLFAYAKGCHQIDAFIETPVKQVRQRETLLHLACYQKDFPMVKWLLKKGANLDAGDANMSPPLTIALANKSTDMARLLIEKGANIHSSDLLGISQLMRAVEYENLEILKLLKEKGANFKQTNDFDTNPLGLAIASFKSVEIVKFLIDNGAALGDQFTENLSCEQAAYFAQIPLQEPSEVNKETVEAWNRAFLTNIWTLYQNSHFFGEEISLMGGVGRIGIKEMIRGFTDFQNQFFKDHVSFEFVKKILNENSIFWNANPKDCAERFKAGQPLLFDSGYVGHCISILYYGPYLVILNRGGRGKDHAIFVQKIDRQKAHLREKDWEMLLRGRISSSIAERYFYEILPTLSGICEGGKNDAITEIFHHFLINDQAIGNCWLVSPKLFPLVILVISKLIDLLESQPHPNSKISSYFYRRRQAKMMDQAYFDLYKPFTSYLRLNSLKTYLQDVVERIETLERNALKPDHELIQMIMKKYHSKYSGRFSFFKGMETEIEGLYRRYLVLFDKKPSSSLIPKSLLKMMRRFKPKIQMRKQFARNAVWLKARLPNFRLPKFRLPF